LWWTSDTKGGFARSDFKVFRSHGSVLSSEVHMRSWDKYLQQTYFSDDYTNLLTFVALSPATAPIMSVGPVANIDEPKKNQSQHEDQTRATHIVK